MICSDCILRRIVWVCFFFQAEDGIRDLVRSRGLGDVYKRQTHWREPVAVVLLGGEVDRTIWAALRDGYALQAEICLLFTSGAGGQRSWGGLGGRRNL